jgi:hypothetical protein
MSKVKKQHYVPQFYLKNFTSGQDKIYVFDKLQKKSFASKIHDVACQQYFYDFPQETINDYQEESKIESDKISEQIVEKYLATLEGQYSTKLKNFIASIYLRQSITYENKIAFVDFISLQYCRTATTKNYIQRSYEYVSDHERKILATFPDQDINFDLDHATLQALHANFILEHKDLSPYFLNHVWFVGIAPQHMSLYTSDHPIILNPHLKDSHGDSLMGIATYGMEISIPLTPKLNLFLLEKTFAEEKGIKENVIVQLNEENLKNLYLQHIRQSKRQIFSSQNDFKYAQEILTKFPHYSDPDNHFIKIK